MSADEPIRFKNTLVAPSSQLGQALKNRPRDAELHNQIYDQTTAACDKLYGKADRLWFEAIHTKGTGHADHTR
jgi:hypothetical protein